VIVKTRAKQFLFRLLGKDPEAVVVTFLSGEEALAAVMAEEIRRLVPDRRHFTVPPQPGSAWQLYRRLRRQFRGLRIGLAPVLFTGDRRFRALRIAAFLLAPSKILVYNSKLERHHLKLRTILASFLFLRGVPLDRIFLRPRWLFPWKRDRSREPDGHRLLEGRPFSKERPRVAVLSPYFPYPLSHGGAVRIFYMLREIARDFDVVLFAFSEGGEAEETGPVLEFCSRVVLVPKPRYREPRWSTLAPPEVCEYRSRTMRKLWDGYCREFEVYVRQVEYTHLAKYGGDVLVEHDVTFDLHRQVRNRERSFSSWWNWWRWRRFEIRAVRRFRRVVVMSEKDAELLGTSNARPIPNGVDLARFQPEPERPGERLLFIGSFRHFPNIVAYRFFTEQVWPKLRDRFPEMTLTAVAGPDPLLYWRTAAESPEPPSDPRITLLGFVRDVQPLYAEANLVIVPTLVSAGTNLKVLEAMAMERAVVSTPSGCAGLGLEHGVSVWVADSASAFAEGVTTMLSDPSMRLRIAREARRVAEEHFDWLRLGGLQRALLTEMAGPQLVIRPAGEKDLAALDLIQKSSPEAVLWEPQGYLEYDCRVAELGGQVAGFVVCRIVADGESEVLSLVVDPPSRRRGIGKRLMLQVLGNTPGDWFLEVRESNTPAINLYKQLGFHEISRRPNYYQDSGETAVVMRRQSC
jgi:ribosomal protein S18 acetylase RimI-like enzyme/glycosyltransferase involved in cell wall biosynthesis